ncbi:MAG: hypothetical protein H8E44_38120 [Planctomycetes bacterium]|nr:hypothetical protein [Planctomycetota bacterium]
MMRGCIRVLCGALVAAAVVGCELKPASTPPGPPAPKVTFEPAKPEKSVPAATAGEPEENLVEAGRQQLKENKYQPMPVYSRAGTLGIIRLVEADVCTLGDAVVVLEDKDITDSRLKLEDGEVFFNVDKTGPVKVGDFELKKGECVLFSNGQFSKLDIVVSVK